MGLFCVPTASCHADAACSRYRRLVRSNSTTRRAGRKSRMCVNSFCNSQTGTAHRRGGGASAYQRTKKKSHYQRGTHLDGGPQTARVPKNAVCHTVRHCGGDPRGCAPPPGRSPRPLRTPAPVPAAPTASNAGIPVLARRYTVTAIIFIAPFARTFVFKCASVSYFDVQGDAFGY